MMAAPTPAQGDQLAATAAENGVQQAEQAAGDQVKAYLGAARTGATLAWGKSKTMGIINGAFGLYDGVSGLMSPNASGQDAFKAGIGLLQTVESLAPIKGPNGDIVRTALTGMGIAAGMWP